MIDNAMIGFAKIELNSVMDSLPGLSEYLSNLQ